MTFITTIDEIVDLFPPGSVDVDEGELHSPCPFCTSGGTRLEYRGIAFYGEDRLIWFSDRAGVSCRKCGHYSPMQALVDLLAPGSEVSTELAPTEIVKEITEPVVATDEYVQHLHERVDRTYWRKFNWSDETIDHFQLGYGRMYEFGSVQALRHVIPFHPHRIDREYPGWAFEGRLPKNDRSGEAMNIKTKGMKHGGWFWWIEENPSDSRVAVTEGLKDAISAHQLGYRNIMAIFGASVWDAHFAAFLYDKGYERADIFGDNDEAGQVTFNPAVALDLHANGIKPYALQWKDFEPNDGSDLTDLLTRLDIDGSLKFLEDNLKLSGQTRGKVKDYRTVDPSYEPPFPTGVTDLQTIRDDLPLVLREFKTGYAVRKKKAKRGVVKVLLPPPGSGKSYALVHFAQEQARAYMAEYDQTMIEALQAVEEAKLAVQQAPDLEELTQAEGMLKRLERAVENASQAKILFAAPFINGWDDIISQPDFDPALWYNFRARGPETCENHEVANALGEKGYAVAKFCETQCPFAQRCREVGYLKQEKERKAKPITFVRHANLVSDNLLVGYKDIIIDENFLEVFAEFVEVDNMLDLVPSRASWTDYNDIDFLQSERIEQFMEAVRKTLVSNMGEGEDGMLSGLSYLTELQKNLDKPLRPFMESLDGTVIRDYQPVAPPVFTEVGELPRRVAQPLYNAIMDELEDFSRGQIYNSRLHQIDGKLFVSGLFPLRIPASKPIIVADGTAFPELYGYLFNRSVEIYSPELYNPEAVIEQLYGSDFTRSSIRKQVGSYTYQRLARSDAIQDEAVPDILGEEVDLSAIPVTEDMFDSDALNRMFSLLLEYAATPEYEKVLFVTYKPIKAAFEKRLMDLSMQVSDKQEQYKALFGKLAFGHYGGLRGTNRYKDYDAVMLAGCPRQPYRQMHMRIQAWARMAKKKDYIPYEIVPKPAPYHGINIYEGYTYYTFEDAFADQFVKMYEEGEIRQCMDRIRLYSRGKKHALLLMGRPAVKWVTSVESSRKRTTIADESRGREVLDFIAEIESLFTKLPSVPTLVKKFGISRSTAQRYLKHHKERKKEALPLAEA